MAETESREIRGLHMDRDEVDAFLADQGYEVLSLADRNAAYGVPVSFGYDGESRLFLYLIQFGDSSRKLDFADHTETACLVTFDVKSRFRWRSAIVSGAPPTRRGRGRPHGGGHERQRVVPVAVPAGGPDDGCTRA